MYYNGCFFTKNASQALSGKTLSLQNTFFQDFKSAIHFWQRAAARSHSQPFKWPQVAASGRWSKGMAATCSHSSASGCWSKWPPRVSEASAWQPLAATCSHLQPLAATCSHSSGGKWLLQQIPSEWPEVAAFRDFNFHPHSNPSVSFIHVS